MSSFKFSFNDPVYFIDRETNRPAKGHVVRSFTHNNFPHYDLQIGRRKSLTRISQLRLSSKPFKEEAA
jgi:predicted secreted protein